ncbi:hypothetical protein WAK64_07925 [Bacillus spongiae]|uniref:Uncharacterized protein n=1 Tax=Bacillus spongiae TaxID=2683610 RepID=A0ABU8HD58_9BACI
MISTSQGWNAWLTDDTSIEINEGGTGEIRLRWTTIGRIYNNALIRE